jgi:hypothetical protein
MAKSTTYQAHGGVRVLGSWGAVLAAATVALANLAIIGAVIVGRMGP